MNILSVLVGLFALLWALVAFIPLFGWMYWLVIPVALVGYALGAMSRHTAGKGINMLVIVIGIIRLIIGHGIF